MAIGIAAGLDGMAIDEAVAGLGSTAVDEAVGLDLGMAIFLAVVWGQTRGIRPESPD